MILDEDIFFNRLVDDEEEEGMSQEEKNEENIYKHDAEVFYENIDKRLSHPSIRNYLEKIPDTDLEYWERIFFKFVSSYYLSPLVNEFFVSKDLDFVANVKRLIFDVKSKMIELFEFGNIKSTISRDELLYRYSHVFGNYFNFFLKYVSDEFYNRFINVVYEESKEESVL